MHAWRLALSACPVQVSSCALFLLSPLVAALLQSAPAARNTLSTHPTLTPTGAEYMPGLVGLNNMKSNDYANVVIHILSRVTPIR